ncbi:hypothetical protein K2173_004738 [Erythroxylum novogranatense]|uniref:Uncharacterized protein n=1 Tax=Erythroxylum novogranatense TaxID=1862640 RepID=A0AAV8U9I4_9ROSI|nr:hypothetical protein K2173_004738 [Erythroxylum novogranatense]
MESCNFGYSWKGDQTRRKDHWVDVGSFFLVEATGDSDDVHLHPPDIAVDLADDDAGSCSYDVSDHSCVSDLNNDDCGCYEGEKYCGNVEEEEIRICGGEPWRSDVGFHQKSCASVDSTTSEPMTEMEKNRLFWETCLAS